MENKISGINFHKAGLTVLIWILALQSPLEKVWDSFSYIDEVTALIGACLCLYDIVVVRKGHPSKEQLWVGIPLLIFAVAGLAGNVIYQYQPWTCVIIDLYTNLKFFFAIGTGYYLFVSMEWEELKKTAGYHARLIVLFLFAVFLGDRVFHIWPGEIRYGISSAVLFYAHSTYLAGAIAFLLVLLTAFYDKKNLPYIAMAVVIMIFTLRAKALASAAAYVAMFLFFCVWKRNLKLWHVIMAGAGSIAIAWNKIQYYFINLAGSSARSVMLQKSFAVMKDYFPIGTGFGTYGSAEAAKYYSPVYIKYEMHLNYELRDINNIELTKRMIASSDYLTRRYQNDPDTTLFGMVYLMDSFWPTVFAQGGIFGTIAFLTALLGLVKRCLAVEKYDRNCFVGALYIMVYLIISSVAEPAFFNSVAIPLAMTLGVVFAQTMNITVKK